MSAVKAFPVPSLIQGISQQSAQSVGQASAKNQENCINDLLLGSRARNGSTVRADWSGSRSGSFFHRIERSPTEDYLVVVMDGSLEIINLASGVKSTITGDIDSYLNVTGTPEDSFVAATIEDTTFLANKETIPAMASTTSTARENWAICHFKALNYYEKYTLNLVCDGITYTCSYQTVDGRDWTQEIQLKTEWVGGKFKEAIDSVIIPALDADGKTGFTVEQRGSALLIDGGTHPFSIYCTDGHSEQSFIAINDRVEKISDLPKYAWEGFQVAIGIEDEYISAADYWVEFKGDYQDGSWEEIVKPGTKTSLDATTMPHKLVNTGLDAFTVEAATWGDRLAGDGLLTAKDPHFVGRAIKDLQFVSTRLAIITEGSYDFSRDKNAYVFFPDTVQTILDTAPIGSTIANGKVTLVSKSVVMAERLQLWANKIQTHIDTSGEPLKEKSISNDKITSYEYDGEVHPLPVGMTSLVFGTSRGLWCSVTEVIFRPGGTPIGEIRINSHCPKLIPGTLKDMQAGDASSMLLVRSSGDDIGLFLYQWYNSGEQRVQSAWNQWTFPNVTKVVWAGMCGSKVYLLLDWASTYSLEVVETEYEGDETGQTPLRSDHRVDESKVTSEGSGYRVLTLPYGVASAQRSNFVAYERVTDAGTGEQRGRLLDLEWQSDTVVHVKSDIALVRFNFGAKVIARRDPHRLYISDPKRGTMLMESVKVADLTVSHNNAGYYRLEVTAGGSVVSDDEFLPREPFDPQDINNQIAIEESGEERFRIGYDTEEFTMSLVNDTILPSSWEALKYHYIPTVRTS